MRSRLLNDGAQRTFALIFSTDDEFMEQMQRFADEQHLAAASFTAIGAFSRAQLAFFDWETKEYLPIPVTEQVEVLSMVGDVALKDGRPKVHAHVLTGKRDGSVVGGHVQKAYVRPTLEVMLTESPEHLQRREDPESHLALISV